MPLLPIISGHKFFADIFGTRYTTSQIRWLPLGGPIFRRYSASRGFVEGNTQIVIVTNQNRVKPESRTAPLKRPTVKPFERFIFPKFSSDIVLSLSQFEEPFERESLRWCSTIEFRPGCASNCEMVNNSPQSYVFASTAHQQSRPNL